METWTSIHAYTHTCIYIHARLHELHSDALYMPAYSCAIESVSLCTCMHACIQMFANTQYCRIAIGHYSPYCFCFDKNGSIYFSDNRSSFVKLAHDRFFVGFPTQEGTHIFMHISRLLMRTLREGHLILHAHTYIFMHTKFTRGTFFVGSGPSSQIYTRTHAHMKLS
jgi:hypothetical protein